MNFDQLYLHYHNQWCHIEVRKLRCLAFCLERKGFDSYIRKDILRIVVQHSIEHYRKELTREHFAKRLLLLYLEELIKQK